MYHVGGYERRVQDGGPGRGGTSVGGEEVQAEHELRQDESGPEVLLRQKHNDQGMNVVCRCNLLKSSGYVSRPQYWNKL